MEKVFGTYVILSAMVMIMMLASVNCEAKLKIGVKKRIENCTAKTRKGDFVHMHYTVRLQIIAN